MPLILGEKHFVDNISRHLETNETVGVIFEGPTNSGKTLLKDDISAGRIAMCSNIKVEIAKDLASFKDLYCKWSGDDEKRIVILKTQDRQETISALKEPGMKRRVLDIFLFAEFIIQVSNFD